MNSALKVCRRSMDDNSLGRSMMLKAPFLNLLEALCVSDFDFGTATSVCILDSLFPGILSIGGHGIHHEYLPHVVVLSSCF